MLLIEIQDDVQKYGVFAALVAVAGMVVAAVGGIGYLWRGPLSGWEVPGQTAILNKIIILPSAMFLVVGFIYASPETLLPVVIVGCLLVTISTVAGAAYATMAFKYRRIKKVVDGDSKTRDVFVLAGDQLTNWAQKTMEKENLTDQQAFLGTPHDPYTADAVWMPDSRVKIFSRMVVLFVIALFCGTGGLMWLAYAVEVKVTGQPAYAVLSPTQIPTGNPADNQKKPDGR